MAITLQRLCFFSGFVSDGYRLSFVFRSGQYQFPEKGVFCSVSLGFNLRDRLRPLHVRIRGSGFNHVLEGLRAVRGSFTDGVWIGALLRHGGGGGFD